MCCSPNHVMNLLFKGLMCLYCKYGITDKVLLCTFYTNCKCFKYLLLTTATPDQIEGNYGNITNVNQFIFPRNKLQITKELGRGEFGKVMLGKATEIEPGKKETEVAVKTLKGVYLSVNS